MSGREQHIIPKHFIKPFACPEDLGVVWLYRRGFDAPRKSTPKKVAKQSYFYSKPNTGNMPSLDDLITSYEKYRHQIVNQIRQLEIGDEIDAKEIAEVVVHLAVRSSHFREAVSDLASAMFSAMQEFFHGELGKSLATPQPPASGIIFRQISNELKKLGLLDRTPITETTIIDLFYFALREMRSNPLNEIPINVSVTLGGIIADMGKIVKDAHVSALGKTLAPEKRVAKLSELIWHVLPNQGDDVILPDCTSIAFDGNEWRPLLFINDPDKLRAVVLPLTPDRLAVGKVKHDKSVDISQFNYHASRASYSYFLSNHTSQTLSEYMQTLGGEMRMSITEMTANIVSDVTGEILGYKPKDDESLQKRYASRQTWDHATTERKLNYSISFADFGDETLIKSVAQEIGTAIAAFSKRLPTSSLNGFTFANDHKTALNSVDRGFEVSGKTTPTKTEEFVGIGMPITIISDGSIKVQAVLQSHVAVGLLAEDRELADDARSAIDYMLASSALTGLIARKFPEQMLKPIQDPYELFLDKYVPGVFNTYFCTAESIRNERRVDDYENMAFSALHQALIRIPEEREAYERHRDLNGLYETSALLVANVLVSFARVFGSYQAYGREISQSPRPHGILLENGLEQWVDLFHKDLEGFRENLDSWNDFSEKFFVHRHFVRLMVHFGILPDRADDPDTGDPGIYIHLLQRV